MPTKAVTMLPKRPGRPPDSHRLERLADVVAERFWRRVELGVEYYSIHGRPAHTVQLTEREEIERYNDPVMREATRLGLEQREGPEAAQEWLDKMERKTRSPF